jgi:pimeloyl-ACP methyl ester carboxylesterase
LSKIRIFKRDGKTMDKKTISNGLKNQRPLSAFYFTLVASILVISEGAYWFITKSFFVVRFDLADNLFLFGPGLMLALSSVLLYHKPSYSKLIGLGIGIFAVLSVVSGGGFLIGFALGVIGGVLSLFWHSQVRFIRPFQNRLLQLTMKNRVTIMILLVVGAVLLVMPTEISYQLNMNPAREKLINDSKLMNTPHGTIEYADVGEGYPVLISHGTGLGYTQLQSVEQMLGTESYRFITPSRFGYLRTPLPSNDSFAAQADLFANLLDTLNISKVIIMGVSIGGPAALAFAEQYPDRCSALIMASAVSHETPNFDLMGTIIHQVVFRSDFGFWMLSNSFQSELVSFIGVSQQVQANMTSLGKQYVLDMLQAMQPISLRQPGMVNDPTHSVYELSDFPIDDIAMPTLVIHAKDDSLVPFDHGQYTAERINGAKFVQLETGGHLLVGNLDRIQYETRSFLREKQIIE